ncbi:ATPase associated with various cellular activities family protein [Hydrogenophaga sp. RAC07]|uniref:ATP-binding protein n=1 Tax=Hydrogenophaga sp. RAC07 TaxID=1842537 RepID=UPI00083CDC6B|nr:ATP-binding protein [Hydrogenophaga sp. RAC07]AOF85222.1 ATPase associated with various cellular activities family protein [Hydrogenophaga sp. RAC07]
MNAPLTPALAPPLATRLLALLAPQDGNSPPPAAQWLYAQSALFAGGPADPGAMVAQWLAHPVNEDRALAQIAHRLSLNVTECMALVLCHAVSTNAYASRALAWLQGGDRTASPSPGLLASLDARCGRSAMQSLAALLDGEALASGLLQLDGHERALPDARLHIPVPLVLALSGGAGRWPNVSMDTRDLAPLAPGILAEAGQRASRLGASECLIVRSGHPREARAVCAAVAQALGKRPAFIHGEPPPGVVPWLMLHDAIPVLLAELAPGERRALPDFAVGRFPLLVACGPEGNADLRGQCAPSWTVPIPSDDERAALWRWHQADPESAWQLGAAHRHCSARIEELARATRSATQTSGAAAVTLSAVAQVARQSGQGALGSLAELMPEDIDEHALVLPAALRRDLQDLAARCRAREGLADGLGIAARSRYRAGVRALLVGASGTGKTLACAWLATRLGMPLYRVDLASVTSKYIGETEKNLGELFARAESAEVIILFDEADALFGKRTDVKDANDRFANQQTNYLLQRIEAYDGIVYLTSNSRARFDSAFTRRLDVILEFPMPAADERRDLWLAHLGLAHDLAMADLNRLAANCDLAGGHIRNACLMAAVAARAERRPVACDDVLRGITAEYRKLGKQLPAGLSERPGGG